jgi:uncharacterized protein RhaS with RHS repeats
MYDYGARNYDPALGRSMNIDPLASKYLSYRPYTYAMNNPVYFIDIDGMRSERPLDEQGEDSMIPPNPLIGVVINVNTYKTSSNKYFMVTDY